MGPAPSDETVSHLGGNDEDAAPARALVVVVDRRRGAAAVRRRERPDRGRGARRPRWHRRYEPAPRGPGHRGAGPRAPGSFRRADRARAPDRAPTGPALRGGDGRTGALTRLDRRPGTVRETS